MVERTVTDVPINIDLTDTATEQLGYQMFGETKFTADVTVRGPKYQLAESFFGAGNIRLSANVDVVSAGLKTLKVSASVVDTTGDITIVSYTQETVEVYFDQPKQTEYTIEPEIDYAKNIDPEPEGYIIDTPILSVSSTVVNGPATEVSKIKRVVARVNLDQPLTENTTVNAQIVLLMNDNSSPKYCTCDVESDLSVTIPVLKQVDLPVSVSFINQPIAYQNKPLNVTISPARVNAAVPADQVDATQTLEIGAVDFSEIDNKLNHITVDVASIEAYRILDSDLTQIRITIDGSAMNKQTFEVPVTADTVTFLNVPEGVTASIPKDQTVPVTVIGPEDSLAELTAAGIYAEVDYANIAAENGNGEITATARFFVKSQKDCWCYGSYKLNVSVDGLDG